MNQDRCKTHCIKIFEACEVFKVRSPDNIIGMTDIKFKHNDEIGHCG